MYILKKLWQWIGDYFTLQQLIGIFGGAALMSTILTGFAKFLSSLGAIEKIFIVIGLALLLTSIVMLIWSRFKKRAKEKRLRNKEWIAKNMPYLAKLRINLAKANERASIIANKLAERNISYSTMEKCNKTYEQMVKSGMVKKPFSFTDKSDIKTARKIWRKTIPKVGKNIKLLIDGMNAFAEIMEKERIGLAPSLKNDNEYQQLLSKINEQKAVANSKIATAITIYNNVSYGGNCSYMFLDAPPKN